MGDRSDFNDMAAEAGLPAVQEAIRGAKAPAPDAAPGALPDWQEPVRFGGGPALEDIPASLIPGVVGEYAAAVARELQVPEAITTLLALAVVATCIQRRYAVAPRLGSSYTEPLSLFALVEQPSSSRKTESKRRMMAPLLKWEKQARRTLRAEIAKAGDAEVVRNKRMNKLVGLLADASGPEQEASLQKELGQLRDSDPPKLAEPQLVAGDVTVEKLEDLLAVHREKMAIFSDEGGCIATWGGIYSSGESRLDVLLQGHAGAPLRVDRQSRSAHLERPAVTVAVLLQPEILSETSEGVRKRFRHTGFLARFAVARPPSLVGRRDVRQEHPVPAALSKRYEDLISSLIESPEDILEETAAPAELDEAVLLTLSDVAVAHWTDYRARVEEMMADGGPMDHMRDWAGKAPGLVLRIAGLMHAADTLLTDLVIKDATLAKAVEMVIALEPHARSLLDSLGGDQASSDARRLAPHLERMARAGVATITRTGISDAVKGTLAASRLDRAILVLQDRAYLGQAATEKTSGRSRLLYPINPRLGVTGW